MDQLLEKKRSISFSDESSSTFASLRSRKSSSPVPTLKFLPTVQVAMLPWQEREEARKARSGNWKPAPLSDELWDGESMCFRDVELTPEEFKALLNGGKRKKSPMPLKAFARMFSMATSSQQSAESADEQQQHSRLEGVDIVHARARVYAEDFDEEDRDSNGRLGSTESNINNATTTGIENMPEGEPAHIVMKLSCEQIGDEIVLTFQPDLQASRSPPPPPPPPQSKKRPTEDRTTKFLPSPPPGPSPSELARGLLSPENQEIKTKISNSNVPFFTGPQFVCGDGKRPLFFMGEQPLRDEHEFVDPSTAKPAANPQSRQKKRSIFGAMFSGMFSSSPQTVILT